MELDPALLTKLIQVLDSLAKKIAVGVPTNVPGSNPLIISNTEETDKANLWGETLQVGKFFPNNKSVGMLKPLLSGLNTMFRQIFLDELPIRLKDVLGANLGIDLSTSFSAGGIGQVSDTGAINNLLAVGKALGLIAASFIAFGLVTDDAFKAGLEGLALVLGAVWLISKTEKDITTGTNLLSKLSSAFLLSSIGFLVFNLVDEDSIYDGIKVLGALVAAVVLMSTFKTQLTTGSTALLIVSLSLIPIAFAFNLMKDVDWSVAAIAIGGITALAVIAGIIGGFAPLAGFIALGAGVIALLGLSLIPLSFALKSFSEINSAKLPQLGTDMGMFLTNLNENITVSTLAFLPGIALALTGLGSALLDFGKFIPLLITLPTSGLVSFGKVIGTFLDSLTENISLGTISRTRILIPLLADISPILTQLSASVQRFGEAQTNILPAKAADISNFFKNLDISTGWFGDADNKITALKQFGEAIQSLRSPDQSFSEFINAFSSLGDVKINVDVLSSETKKTNEILQTSVSIQTQQLSELKQQTSILSKMQIPQNISTGNQAQPYPSSINAIPGTRDQYNNSSYFLKSR